MSIPSLPDDNPYRSPSSELPGIHEGIYTPGSLSNTYHRENLRQFRMYMHVVGGIFMTLALLVVLAGALLTSLEEFGQESMIFLVIFGGIGTVWFGLGVAICLKQMWALYIGTGLCYLSLIGNLLRLNLCAMVILVALIALAHTAMARARPLRRAGIPLTTKPHQLG